MKKEHRSLGLAAVMLLVSVGFINAGGQSEPAKATAPAPSAKPVVLRWFTNVQSQIEIDQWKELAADVTKQYPNITVEIESTDWNNYWTKLPAAIASGSTQDLLTMQGQRSAGFATQGCIPLNDFIAKDKNLNFDDFEKGILGSLSVDGKVYGLPYDVGPFLLFYNIDLFDKYGVPYPDDKMDLSGFLDRARKLTQDGNYGYAPSIHWERIMPFVLGNDVTFYDAKGKYNLNRPEIIQAAKFYSELITKEKVAPAIINTGNQYQDRESFYAGKCGMYIDGPWNITNIKKNSKFKLGAAPMMIGMKKRATMTAGSGFMVSKTSKYPLEAYQALTVLTGKASLEKLAGWGRALPARKSGQHVFFEKNTDVKGLVEAMAVSGQPGVSFPYQPPANYQQAYLIIINNFTQPILLGLETVENAAAKTQKLLDEL
ncbi:MAG: sugar ABC transporter substrate-binding protein [Treponemataceae bacterium]